MKALLITGSMAKPLVERYARALGDRAEVEALPIKVAALMTPAFIAKQLSGRDLSKYDFVMAPGMVRGDLSAASEAVGARIFKGPKHASQIPLILEAVWRGELRLSHERPACELAKELMRRRAFEELREIEEEAAKGAPGAILIGGGGGQVWVGGGIPPRVLAEIPDAHELSDEAIARAARRYAESGAHIIDVGMGAGGGRPADAKRAIKAVKAAVDLPVSIDSCDPEEIRAAVDAGADLILSINADNMEEVSEFAPDVPAVVTPEARGRCPRKARSKLRALRRNLERARGLGFRKLIADPVLGPPIEPGLAESIAAYISLAKAMPNVPTLMGVGNVTEMSDCDSVGINFALAMLACELGVAIVFTTEASDKTAGSVRELRAAVDMGALAKRRGCTPKDLGIDLLLLKEKRRADAPLELPSGVRIVEAKPREWPMDALGCFRILVDREWGKIAAIHYKPGASEPDVAIIGDGAAAVYSSIIELGLVGELSHAAYLGRELAKAEVALATGRSYVQDEPPF